MSQQIVHEPLWRIEHRTVTVRGQARSMRLVAFERTFAMTHGTIGSRTHSA